MATILDGKKLAQELLLKLKQRTERLQKPPRLAVVFVGEDPASEAFLRVKARQSRSVGADFRLYRYPADISGRELAEKLNTIVQEAHADGIVVQLPLPGKLDANRHALLRILPEALDVDCLSERWHGRLQSGRTKIQLKHGSVEMLPPVAAAVLHLFSSYKIDLHGKDTLIVGWGDLVGKPLVPLLLRQGATVTVAQSTTKDFGAYAKRADVLISGVGKAGIIQGAMIKKGAVVIDAGVSEASGEPKGDVEFTDAEKRASYITPVPGGLGPLGVAMLLGNLVSLAEARHGIPESPQNS